MRAEIDAAQCCGLFDHMDYANKTFNTQSLPDFNTASPFYIVTQVKGPDKIVGRLQPSPQQIIKEQVYLPQIS